MKRAHFDYEDTNVVRRILNILLYFFFTCLKNYKQACSLFYTFFVLRRPFLRQKGIYTNMKFNFVLLTILLLGPVQYMGCDPSCRYRIPHLVKKCKNILKNWDWLEGSEPSFKTSGQMGTKESEQKLKLFKFQNSKCKLRVVRQWADNFCTSFSPIP